MDFSSPTLDATRHRLRARFGARVGMWWDELPTVLAELTERWELVVGEPVGSGNTSLVLRCRLLDGRSAVLKLTPEPELATAEAGALRSWEPSGRVPFVWGHDRRSGALLLEAIPNELPLSKRGHAVGLDQVTDLIGALHRTGAPVVADGVVPVAERVEFVFEHWVERHRRSEGVARAVPASRLRQGHELARVLAGDVRRQVLLHGDLHPGNVLDGTGTRGLVAIDPRPCVGDPAFDAVDWVFWRLADPHHWRLRGRELARALELEPDRLWAWCSAFAAVLAAGEAARGAGAERIAALLAVAP